jgi:hypothetical protein
MYVVSSGSYSDYRVLCICDSKERAEQVAAALRADSDGWRSDAGVETLPLVTTTPEKVITYDWQIEIWDDGTTTCERKNTRTEWPFDPLYGESITRVSWRWVRAPVHKNKGGRLEVKGTDRTRVAKVFTEKRAQLLSGPGLRDRSEAKGRA